MRTIDNAAMAPTSINVKSLYFSLAQEQNSKKIGEFEIEKHTTILMLLMFNIAIDSQQLPLFLLLFSSSSLSSGV